MNLYKKFQGIMAVGRLSDVVKKAKREVLVTFDGHAMTEQSDQFEREIDRCVLPPNPVAARLFDPCNPKFG